jgi:hypothetical protein
MVQAVVASIVARLLPLDLDAAAALMEETSRVAKTADPVMWAKAKDSHLRMRALVEAALTFQNTVVNIQGQIPKRRTSPIVLLS